MRSTDRRLVVGVVAALAILSGCGSGTSPSPSPTSPPPSISPSGAATTPSAEPSTTPAVAADPGQPYEAAAILEAMRSSRRPGGVPDELETDAIAAAVADEVWTFDGAPWAVWSVGGSCGPTTCTLEVGGTPSDAIGEDLYVLEVTPASASVELVEASLHGLSQNVVDRLDREARNAWSGADLGEMVLASAAWHAPPHASEFVLSYRSGGEEGAPGLDLVLDVASGAVTER